MKEAHHKNYKIASNFICFTLVLDIVELVYAYTLLQNTDQFIFAIIWFMAMALTAYIVRRGVNGMKYILLIINILVLWSIIISANNTMIPLFNRVIMCIDFIFFIVAAVFLFKVPLPSDQKSLDSDI